MKAEEKALNYQEELNRAIEARRKRGLKGKGKTIRRLEQRLLKYKSFLPKPK